MLEIAPSPAFESILTSGGCLFQYNYPWLYVSSTTRRQGWKLHLSSIPTQAEDLLRSVIPILQQAKIAWKCAASLEVLMKLNEGGFGVSQIGKFLTIYPTTDEESWRLAHQILEVTAGFDGPEIVTDLRLGDALYARFGGMSPDRKRDRLGNIHTFIEAADGTLVKDEYNIPFVDPPGQVNPFTALDRPRQSLTPGLRLLAKRYLVTDVLHLHPRGSVFRGIDLNGRSGAIPIVIKEGRRHCCSDLFGRDMRYRLKRQAALRRQLPARLRIPSTGEYFEEDGNGYLTVEYLEGSSFLQSVPPIWRLADREHRANSLRLAADLAQLLDELHSNDVVHRDVTPLNVRVDGAGNVWLLDLELAHRLGESHPPLQLGTPGFMAPSQQHAETPTVSEDFYGFGATLVRILSGRHPQQVISSAGTAVQNRLLDIGQGTIPVQLARLCALLLSGNASAVSMSRASLTIRELADSMSNVKPTSRSTTPKQERQWAAGLSSAANSLIHGVQREPERGLWLSISLDRPGETGVLLGANRGVAGVVYAASRLLASGFASGALVQLTREAAAWLVQDAPNECPPVTQGLHFGLQGVAVALAEASRASLISREIPVRVAREMCHEPFDWPDLTHGVAGHGMAVLQIADLLPQSTVYGHLSRCLEYLLDSQGVDGLWPSGQGSPFDPDERFYGFAHGAAGIAYFLAEADLRSVAPRTMAESLRRSWMRALQSLLDLAQDSGDATDWPWSTKQHQVWRTWCHGAPGIALAFLRAYEVTGKRAYASAAQRALNSAAQSEMSGDLGQCHGLSGIGEVYLEAHRVLGDPCWRRRARAVASDLVALRHEDSSGGWAWTTEDPDLMTADLMVGTSGILHFLVRELTGGTAFGLPLLTTAPGSWAS